MIFYRKI